MSKELTANENVRPRFKSMNEKNNFMPSVIFSSDKFNSFHNKLKPNSNSPMMRRSLSFPDLQHLSDDKGLVGLGVNLKNNNLVGYKVKNNNKNNASDINNLDSMIEESSNALISNDGSNSNSIAGYQKYLLSLAASLPGTIENKYSSKQYISSKTLTGNTNTSNNNNGSTFLENGELKVRYRSIGLWQYLLMELYAPPKDISINAQFELVVNFFYIPLLLESTITYGCLCCVDSFLSIFTILPMRIILAFIAIIKSFTIKSFILKENHIFDLLRGFFIVITLYFLFQLDSSKIYHIVRRQAAVKLYVIFNVFETGDRLLSALGQDMFDCIFFRPNSSSIKIENKKKSILFLAALFYNVVHSILLFYMVLTLNVAANSYSNALLPLLLSNQFGEIKSAVFKKFERENLFQLTCADIAERFQLWLMLLIIFTRNIIEQSSVHSAPTSFYKWCKLLFSLFGPSFIVIGSEVIVDWLKHAYITKFNHLKPGLYTRYLDVLCTDYSKHFFSDQIVTRRFGIPLFPLACVAVRIAYPLFKTLTLGSTGLLNDQEANLFIPFSEFNFLSIFNFANYHTVLLNWCRIFAKIYLSWSFVFAVLIFLCSFAVLVVTKLLVGACLLRYSYSRVSKLSSQKNYKHVSSKSSSSRSSRSKSRHSQINKSDLSVTSMSYDDSASNDYVRGRKKAYGTIDLPEHIRRGLYKLPNESIPSCKADVPSKNVRPLDLTHVNRFKMVDKRIW